MMLSKRYRPLLLHALAGLKLENRPSSVAGCCAEWAAIFYPFRTNACRISIPPEVISRMIVFNRFFSFAACELIVHPPCNELASLLITRGPLQNRNFAAVLRLSKNYRDRVGKQSRGGARGGKTRLEYNQTPPQKLDFSSFWEKAFCPLTKCSAAEAQSKKSITGFFDKLGTAAKSKFCSGPFILSGSVRRPGAAAASAARAAAGAPDRRRRTAI